MKYKYILIAIIILSQCSTATAWLTGYDYRMPIQINNTGVNLSNYAYSFTVDTAALVAAGKMQADGDDCRITNATDILQPFWNETPFNASSTMLWVNATSLGNITNTTHYMHYGNSSVVSVADAISTFEYFDGFERWIKYASNPVLDNSTPLSRFDDYFVATPCIVQNGTAEEYYMYYTGSGLPTPDHQCRESVGLAISTDLINWIRYNGSATDYRLLDCGVSGDFDYWRTWGMGTTIRENATSWKLWYTGDSDSTAGHITRIGYATSPNGKNWTKYIGSQYGNSTFVDMDGASSGSRGAMQPAIIKINDTHYKMWYKIYQNGNIKYATSSDGITWAIQNSNNPVILGSEGILTLGDVKLVDGTYYLTASHSTYTKISTWTSTNCISWTKHADELLPSTSGWDSQDVYGSTFFQKYGETNKWYLFYSGGYTSGEADQKIGFATIEKTIPLSAPPLGEWTMSDGSNIQTTTVKSGTSAMELLDDSASGGHRGGILKSGLTLENKILEYDYKYPTQDPGICQPIFTIADGSANTIYLFAECGTNLPNYEWKNSSAALLNFSGGAVTIPFGDGDWHKMGHSLYDSSPYMSLDIDNVSKGTGGLVYASYQTPVQIQLSSGSSGGTGTIGWMDDVRIRKYAATEPTTAMGAEDTAPAHITIPSTAWFYTFLIGANAMNVSTIKASIDADGLDCYALYRWNGTSYVATGDVKPCEGIIVYCNNTGEWSP